MSPTPRPSPGGSEPKDEKTFLVYRLNGRRFDNHEVPLSFLGELQSYQKLFFELAHKLYLERNTTRKNVPKGFYDAFSFNLAKIKEGSAELCISFQEEIESDEYDEIKNESKKLIEKNIYSLINENKLVDGFPINLTPYLAEFGKHLLDNETGSFSSPNEKPIALIDRNGNQSIKVFVESQRLPRAVEFNTEGIAFAINTEKTTFGVKLDTLEHLECPLPVRFTKLILSAIEESDLIRVGIKGVFAVLPDGSKTVERIDHINIIDDSPRIGTRLKAFAQLPSNWLNEASISPDSDGLVWLEELFTGLIKQYKIPTPYLFPTPEGNVQAEWSFGEWIMEGVFDLATKQVNLSAFHKPDVHDEEFERDIPLEKPEGLYELVAMIIKYMKL